MSFTHLENQSGISSFDVERVKDGRESCIELDVDDGADDGDDPAGRRRFLNRGSSLGVVRPLRVEGGDGRDGLRGRQRLGGLQQPVGEAAKGLHLY